PCSLCLHTPRSTLFPYTTLFRSETAYLSAEQLPGLTRAGLERGSLFSALQQDYGVVLAHADEEIDATAADPKSAELLNVARGARSEEHTSELQSHLHLVCRLLPE